MRIFNMTFNVTKTCQNGNERTMRTSVLVSANPHEDWDSDTVQKAVDYLKRAKHYYKVEYVSAKPVEVIE